MLRQGPIPVAVHGIVDYAFAALLIVAPFLFGFSDEGGPTAVAVVTGVIVLLLAATTEGFPTSVIKSIPTGAHLVLDLVLGGLFIAAPFVFGFSDESAPTAFFIAAGVAALLLTLATRWRPPA
jgi:VIT1/CCC1 family predicted Fe2+/Mn2+ transporter